jgi:hypothetical protein
LALALRHRFEHAREAQLEPRPLARQQVVADDLAQQRVAEAVAAVRPDGDDVVGERLA